MIFIFLGAVFLAIGLIFLIHPAPEPNQIYGYFSYLSRTNAESHKYAQKISRNILLIMGTITILLGVLINTLKWNNFFLIWLFIGALLIVVYYAVTETYLKKFLVKRNELPSDYINPDDRPRKHEYTKGFKDL